MAYSEQQKQDIFDSICDLIISGKSLRKALLEVTLPAKTFFVWLRENDELSKQYARATTERAELMFEDMFDIADDSENDYTETELGKAGFKLDKKTKTALNMIYYGAKDMRKRTTEIDLEQQITFGEDSEKLLKLLILAIDRTGDNYKGIDLITNFAETLQSKYNLKIKKYGV